MMSFSHEKSVFLPKTPEEVFPVLDDFSSMPKWMDRCLRMQRQGGKVSQTGDLLCGVYRGWVGDRVFVGQLVDKRPMQSICFKLDRHGVGYCYRFTLQRRRGGTYLTQVVEMCSDTAVARVASRWLAGMLRRHSAANLVGLRGYVLNAECIV